MHCVIKCLNEVRKMKTQFIVIFALLAFLLALSGCLGIDTANDHLASMDQSTQQLSQSVSDDQKYLQAFSQQVEQMQKSTTNLESEIAADSTYLQSVADCMKAMSTSLSDLQAIGDSALHTVLDQLLKSSPDPKTPDAQDLLPPVQTKKG